MNATPRQLTLAIFVAVTCATSAVQAAPEAILKPRSNKSQPLTLNQTGCDAVEDAMSVVVTDKGKELAHENFCSLDGRAKAKVVTDKHTRTYIFLEYGENRGPSATTTYLAGFQLAPELIEIVRIPISWPTGPTQRFTYKYNIENDQSGGLRISLHGTDMVGSDCCVPSEKTQTIEIDSAK